MPPSALHQVLIQSPERMIEWVTSREPVPYPEAVAAMDARAAAIARRQAPELVWLLQHPSVYTAGTSADAAELLAPRRFPVHKT